MQGWLCSGSRRALPFHPLSNNKGPIPLRPHAQPKFRSQPSIAPSYLGPHCRTRGSLLLVRATEQTEQQEKQEQASSNGTASNGASTNDTSAPASPSSSASQQQEQQQQQQQQQQQEQPTSSTYKTLSTLDMLLGINEEEERKKKQQEEEAKQQASAATTDSSISPQAMQKLADADAQRYGGQGAPRDDVDGQFQKIIEKAKKLADNQASEADQAQLKQEFDGLLQKISKPPEAMSKEDIKRLKDAAFGPQTFWVTETQPITDLERSGLLIRGNLRDERTKVYEFVCQKVDELFGGKYAVLLVEDTLATEEDMVNGRIDTSSPTSSLNNPRVAFNIVPAAQTVPPQTTGWGSAVSFVLILLLVGSCAQLALAANVTKLPKETLEWFANPANIDNDALPPGLENWDPSEYFKSAVPIFMSILGTNVSHEIGHRLAALREGVRLGPTYFIPNFQIGSFGAITPFTSMLKNRKSMWEVSSAGPLTGAAVSALLLGAGLWLSHGTDSNAVNNMMVSDQTLFGIELFGGVRGSGRPLAWTPVLVSPLVIAGWCGLVTQALQLLPVGNVDGGRMVQSAFGRQALSLSSFFTYVGLGLGLLGSSLALPFGLYVIICQRGAEQYIKDTVSPPGESRSTITAVAVLTAVLVLLPMAPELADAFGIGPTDRFLF
ncbi:membrane associated metalloprotease [Dunaliella salina]|uniref:Membrane associated metalloprotease n=1 Tax=Dunaliella salina TaxID=3046 RepID=A0ABQ7G2X3_DUNSA|nr:membrane associated metalloprotease [Dunaliella salina]|eukprot:KAF5828946.1 membrane associated metalloprotease [Dunaliella salina]